MGPSGCASLADDRLNFRAGSTAQAIIYPSGTDDPDDYHRLIEASWVHLRDGWYYLFFSGDNCCGPHAHYAVLVARARHATGPYETYAAATANPHAALLVANDHWRAPGNNSVVTDAAGQDWLAYHAIDVRQPTFDAIDDSEGYSRRVLLLDKLEYADGWPVVKHHSPSWQPQPGPVAQ
ncbi:family 43 glycosylhydrolase [Hymenobacter humi]|uniref:Family 43 glycosylhydrolase n=1 Tax=Hymenobacter humi TaxID=1411620 RepID=A0ABW2U4L1_9BACT